MKIIYDFEKNELIIFIARGGKAATKSYYVDLYWSIDGNLCKLVIRDPKKVLEILKNFNIKYLRESLKGIELKGRLKELRDNLVKELTI